MTTVQCEYCDAIAGFAYLGVWMCRAHTTVVEDFYADWVLPGVEKLEARIEALEAAFAVVAGQANICRNLHPVNRERNGDVWLEKLCRVILNEATLLTEEKR